MQRVPPQPAGP